MSQYEEMATREIVVEEVKEEKEERVREERTRSRGVGEKRKSPEGQAKESLGEG